MKQIGSQLRQNIKETDLKVFERGKGYIKVIDLDNKKELWYLNNHHCGYTLEYRGHGYEYGRDLQ